MRTLSAKLAGMTLCVASLALLPRLAQGQASTSAPPAPPVAAPGVTSIQEVARIEGQGESVLRGIGIVVGLPGTGDSGADLVLAEPLSQLYASNGIPMPNLESLGKAKSAALVWVECVVRAEGARADDVFTVNISAMHTAKSLKGGRLVLTPLLGPLPRQGAYAIASGPLQVPDEEIPTSAVVLAGSGGGGGARIIKEIKAAGLQNAVAQGWFHLVIEPHFRSYSTSRTIANEINGLSSNLADPAATGAISAVAVDDAIVRVSIPANERGDPSGFIASVMTATFSPSLLDLPAQVVCNAATGSIIVTGDAEISPVNISHKDLTVTTTTPPPVASANDPIVDQSRWVTLQTTGRASERARVMDLLLAFRQIDVPIEDQIAILTQIHKAGRLHARLVIE